MVCSSFVNKYGTFAFVIALAGVLVGAVPHTARAATASEACFTFNATSGTIDDYEAVGGPNNCPADLDIPSTIGGVTVTHIGDYAFSYKGLTSITIPSSVQTIGVNGFDSNNIATIDIPGSVTSIGAYAFAFNVLTSVMLHEGTTTINAGVFAGNYLREITIPNSVTSLGAYPSTLGDSPILTASSIGPQGDAVRDFWANMTYRSYLFLSGNDYLNDPFIQAVQQEAWYVKVYTADPANPSNLTDIVDLIKLKDPSTGEIYAEVPLSGHIINPAQVTVNYKDTSGAPLQPSVVMTGTELADYTAISNTTSDLSRYFRLGDTQQITAPSIAGYRLVSASPYTATLSSRNTVVDFVYSNAQLAAAGLGAPKSGVPRNSNAAAVTAVLLVVVITALVVVKRLCYTDTNGKWVMHKTKKDL